MMKGWAIKSLGELFDFSGGLSASRADLSTKGHPYLHYGDIHGSTQTYVDVCTDRSIPKLDVDLGKVSGTSLLNDGDVVFVDASEDDEGASRHIVVRNTDGRPFISGLHTIVAKSRTEEIDKKFREFCFQTEAIKSQFKFYAVGTKVTGISKTNIGKIVLSYPLEITEQHRIAEALSDTDTLLAAMEKLISKKRAIKQGVMQELLTGKRRLPGFSGEILEKELEPLCETFCDGDWIESKDQSEEGIRLIQTGNIGNGKYLDKSDKKRFVSESTFIRLKCTEILPNDILVSRLPDPAGRACLIPAGHEKAITAVDCTIIRLHSYNPVLFVMYSQTAEYQRQIDLLLAGSTRQRISRRELGKVKVPYFDQNEQVAIASVLTDMDVEIDTLTTKLEKLCHIKQGMMNELLTGRIRLTDHEQVS